MLPLERAQANEIFERTRDVIGASVYGVLVIATIQGMLGALAFWVLGLPSPLLWGVVMLFLSMIPMAGSFIVWVPAAIYLAVTGAWLKAVLLTVWGLLVIGTVDNFLRPKLVGERTHLHELLIFFSVLGGLQVFGDAHFGASGARHGGGRLRGASAHPTGAGTDTLVSRNPFHRRSRCIPSPIQPPTTEMDAIG